MNRYKFRAKDIDQSVWRYGYYFYGFELGYNSQSYDDVPRRCHYIFTDSGYYEVQPNTIGQFTGMKDRNHTDIYEMDIVEYENSIGYIMWCPVQLEYVIVDKIENLELKLGRYFTVEIEVTSDMIDNPNMENVRGD